MIIIKRGQNSTDSHTDLTLSISTSFSMGPYLDRCFSDDLKTIDKTLILNLHISLDATCQNIFWIFVLELVCREKKTNFAVCIKTAYMETNIHMYWVIS